MPAATPIQARPVAEPRAGPRRPMLSTPRMSATTASGTTRNHTYRENRPRNATTSARTAAISPTIRAVTANPVAVEPLGAASGAAEDDARGMVPHFRGGGVAETGRPVLRTDVADSYLEI